MYKTNQTTESFYKDIIKKVLEQSREYFSQYNVPEDVLQEMQKIWAEKLTCTGIFTQNKLNFYAINYRNQFQNQNQMIGAKDSNTGTFVQFKSEKDKTTNQNIELYKKRFQQQQKEEVIYRTNQITNIAVPNNYNYMKTEINNKDNKIKEELEDYDPDVEAFNKNEPEVIKNKEVHDDEEEELSSLSNDSVNYDEGKDFLYTQYEKVHRVKTKWKCVFKDAVLQINGKEYIFDKISGELERDW